MQDEAALAVPRYFRAARHGLELSACDGEDFDRMTEAPEGELFPLPGNDRSTGLWPSQALRGAVMLGHEIMATEPIGDDQIQPASIDLRIGEVAYRVRAS